MSFRNNRASQPAYMIIDRVCPVAEYNRLQRHSRIVQLTTDVTDLSVWHRSVSGNNVAQHWVGAYAR